MKKSLRLITLMAAAAVVLSACGANTPEVTPAAVVSQPNALIAEGRLMPVNVLDQSFSIPGQVAEVLVKDGDSVTAGQVIARLVDSPEAAAALARANQETLSAQQALNELVSTAGVALAQAKVQLIAAEKELETAQEKYDADTARENRVGLDAAKAAFNQAEEELDTLEAGDGVDPDLLAAAEARLASAAAAAASAQAAVDAHILKATMDGSPVDVTLQVGQQVAAGQPVMTLADFSDWVVKTDNLTEMEVVAVEVGQQVEVVLDALPDVTLNGVVTQINARYEEKRGDVTYTVTITLNETDPQMRWGMTAAVRFLP